MDEVQKKIKKCIDDDNVTLDLCGMNLLKLPSNLPTFLENLYCCHNNLKELPSNLPNSLKTLYCMDNKINQLPAILPDSLQHLHCYNNELKSLPKLPISLQELYCYNNKYLHIPKDIVLQFHENGTPNYDQKASYIQRKWRSTKYKKIIVKIILDNDNVLSNSFKSYGDLNIVHLIANYVV